MLVTTVAPTTAQTTSPAWKRSSAAQLWREGNLPLLPTYPVETGVPLSVAVSAEDRIYRGSIHQPFANLSSRVNRTAGDGACRTEFTTQRKLLNLFRRPDSRPHPLTSDPSCRCSCEGPSDQQPTHQTRPDVGFDEVVESFRVIHVREGDIGHGYIEKLSRSGSACCPSPAKETKELTSHNGPQPSSTLNCNNWSSGTDFFASAIRDVITSSSELYLSQRWKRMIARRRCQYICSRISGAGKLLRQELCSRRGRGR